MEDSTPRAVAALIALFIGLNLVGNILNLVAQMGPGIIHSIQEKSGRSARFEAFQGGVSPTGMANPLARLDSKDGSNFVRVTNMLGTFLKVLGALGALYFYLSSH